MKIKYILVVLTLAAFVTSCSKITPAGFWTNFHNNLITKKNSDQGPWGGHREIHWKSENANSFSSKELIEFAAGNDWELTDRISISIDTLIRQTNLKYKSDDYSFDIFKKEVLPKLKSTDTVFIFNTTWLAVEPGNTRETFTNGFAILNSNRTELKIYHLWGE